MAEWCYVRYTDVTSPRVQHMTDGNDELPPTKRR